MKLLILSFYYYPDLSAGSFRATALVEQLRKMDGLEIEVITTTPNRYSSFKTNSTIIHEQHDGLVIHRVELPQHKNRMINQVKSFIYFAKEVRKIIKKGNYQIVFATSSRLMTAALGSWVARKKKAKLYLDIRDIFVDTIKDVMPLKISLWAKPVFSVIEKWTCKRADCINLVSKGFQPYFESRYPLQKLSWFTNGIDDEFINTIIEKKPRTDKPLSVLYAGNIGEGQGLHIILPSLAKRFEGRMNFKVIGDGGLFSHLSEKLDTLKCTNVELIPPVNRSKLIAEYNSADILFLHLNDYEAFRKVLPSKLFEYAAVGKPIWAGLSGFSAEFVKSEIKNAAVFEPCDIADAEEVFKELVLETGNRKDFIEKYTRVKIMNAMALDIVSLC